MTDNAIKSLTSYPDINQVLVYLSKNLRNLLSKNLLGLYLFGSLAYGDFNPDSSDIDLVAMIKKPLDPHKLEALKQVHKQVGEYNLKWRDRLECSYTPVEMLTNILPPTQPRPYYGAGIFYEEAPYGNEWLINNYLLNKNSIALIGTSFKELCPPIDMVEVQKACIRDLFQEWEPKIQDLEWLDNSHYQSYLVLNLCRILFTVLCNSTASKVKSAQWVIDKFGLPWSHLIDIAQSWQYGKTMSSQAETIAFIKFTIEKIKQTSLYQQMNISKF